MGQQGSEPDNMPPDWLDELAKDGAAEKPLSSGDMIGGPPHKPRGYPDDRYRRHLALSAWKFIAEYGSALAISSMPLEGALINEGLLPFENDPARRGMVFDSAAGEIVARKVKASVSLEGVGDYLGCEPVVARTVATEGFAERAFSEHFNMVGRAPKVLHRLTTASLDDFLSALFSRAKSVDAFHPNVLPLVRAAKSENWPVGSVIK